MPSAEFDNLVTLFKAQRGQTPLAIPDMRAGFDLLGQMMPVAEGVAVEELDIAGLPSEKLATLDADGDRAILYLHGGGYCIGSRDSHRPLVSTLAKLAKIPVFEPEYRLAPEAPYPAAIDDAASAYGWVLDQGFAPDRVAVAGESAGGGLTLALLLSLRDAGRPLPAAAVVVSPWCDLTGLGDVTATALEVDFLRPEQLDFFADNYAPHAVRTEPLCSPATADLSGLPPLLIQSGEHEILLDQDRRLAAQAKDCGIDATLEVEPEMFHAWHLFTAIPESHDALERAARFIRDKLS